MPDNLDRISNLPNNLIAHILSFLSTKDAVRTSALSTHWNHQWTSITHLDFDDIEMIGRDYPTSPSCFVNFVYRVLLMKVTPLDLFRLMCFQEDYGVTRVTDWISAALSRNVRQIDVSFYMDEVNHIQLDCLFSSRTLVVLKLGRQFILRIPTVISFDNLKILHLYEVGFEGGESLSKLISSCLALEELLLQEILSESVDVVNISSLSLKRLILNVLYPNWLENIDLRHSYEIVLNTPGLQYLEYYEDENLPNGYKIETLHCLDRARLCLSICEGYSDIHNDNLSLNPVAILYSAISNVRILYLSDKSYEGFSYFCDDLNIEQPSFPRLTDLKICGIGSDDGLSLLTTFLKNSPQLASLSFSLRRSAEAWDAPTAVPNCMRYNLKVIKVNGVSGRELELGMMKYFLEKTNCLEELIISWKEEKNEEFIKGVSLLPRASTSCKIVIT